MIVPNAHLSIKKLTPSLVEKNWHPEEAWPRIIYRILLLLTALLQRQVERCRVKSVPCSMHYTPLPMPWEREMESRRLAGESGRAATDAY